MVMFGPMQMFVFGFPGNDFNGMIYPAFEEAKEKGIIRFVDYMLVSKDEDGIIQEIEGTDLGEAELIDLGAGYRCLDGIRRCRRGGRQRGLERGREGGHREWLRFHPG